MMRVTFDDAAEHGAFPRWKRPMGLFELFIYERVLRILLFYAKRYLHLFEFFAI